MLRVDNMTSPKTGNPVANQFIIRHNGAQIFQSYNTVIARITRNGKVQLDRDCWDYSVTTGKYRNQFLGETIAETRAKIEAGIYQLKDLNR